MKPLRLFGAAGKFNLSLLDCYFTRFAVVALMLLLLGACSKTENTGSFTPPKVEVIDALSGAVGDSLTIKGTDFGVNKAEIEVTFNGVTGEVVEADPAFIKVVVPEKAISGLVKITLKGSDIYKVASFTVPSFDLFIFHDNEKKLARINLEKGTLTYIGENIEYGVNTRGSAYSIKTQEYIGFENGVKDAATGKVTPSLVRINVKTGAVKYVNIPEKYLAKGADFRDFAVDSESNGYIFHDNVKKLAKVNIETGELTYIGEDIRYGENTRGAMYCKKTEEYVGFENDLKDAATGKSTPAIVRINVKTGQVKYVSIPAEYLLKGANFRDFTMDAAGNGYVFQDDDHMLAKLDIETGKIKNFVKDVRYENTRGGRIYPRTGEYIGFANGVVDGETNKIYPYLIHVNPNYGSKSSVNISAKYLAKGTDFRDFCVGPN